MVGWGMAAVGMGVRAGGMVCRGDGSACEGGVLGGGGEGWVGRVGGRKRVGERKGIGGVALAIWLVGKGGAGGSAWGVADDS